MKIGLFNGNSYKNWNYDARYKFFVRVFLSFKETVVRERGSEIVIDNKKLFNLVYYYFNGMIPFVHKKLGNQNNPIADRHKIISATTLCIMLYLPVSVRGDNNLRLKTIINAEFARYLCLYVLKLPWRKNSANNLKASGNEIQDDALGKLWPEYLIYLCNIYGYMEEKTEIYSSGYLILKDAGYIYMSIFPIAFLWNMIECCGSERTPLPG